MGTTDSSSNESLQGRISAHLARMSRAERQVAEYLRNNSQEVIFATAEQIGLASGTSDATVVRTARKLGYSGLLELRYSLGHQAVEKTNTSARLRDRLAGAGPEQASLLAQVFTEATERLSETLRLLAEPDFEKAVDILARAREIVAFGVGPSESVARYFTLRLGRLGRRARATGATGFRLADDLLGLGAGDAVVLFSPARLLGEIEVLIHHAEVVGADIVLVSDSLGPLFADRVQVVLQALHSPSGFTGEGLSSQVLADAMIVAITAGDENRATTATELLTTIRSELIQTDSRDYVSRRDRRGTQRDTRRKESD
jgi:DNA-binding MurR/RpiR family transcriptional regulator